MVLQRGARVGVELGRPVEGARLGDGSGARVQRAARVEQHEALRPLGAVGRAQQPAARQRRRQRARARQRRHLRRPTDTHTVDRTRGRVARRDRGVGTGTRASLVATTSGSSQLSAASASAAVSSAIATCARRLRYRPPVNVGLSNITYSNYFF